MSRKENAIYCNCCGRLICQEEERDKTSFLTIKKEWGYFSDKKDGTVHSMEICEECYERLAESFVIPPEIKQITEFM